MSATQKTNPELPRMVCPHCYLSTRADMPRCLYCGTVLHGPTKPVRKSALDSRAHTEVTHRTRAALPKFR